MPRGSQRSSRGYPGDHDARTPPTGCNLGGCPATLAAVITPNMTARGKQLGLLFGLLIVLAIPKHVECGYPDGKCDHKGSFNRTCKTYEVEPFGFYLIEKLAKSDVGFAYSSGDDCR